MTTKEYIEELKHRKALPVAANIQDIMTIRRCSQRTAYRYLKDIKAHYKRTANGEAVTVDEVKDYFFGKRRAISKLVLTGIPIRPNAELTITVTAASGAPVGIGMINVGDYRPLVGDTDWGGTLAGATAEPVTYSYIDTDDYGNTTIIRRHSATNLRLKVAMPRQNADAALASVQEVLDIPVSWIAVNCAGFEGLNVFGLGSGSLSYTFSTAEFDITVKGLI